MMSGGGGKGTPPSSSVSASTSNQPRAAATMRPCSSTTNWGCPSSTSWLPLLSMSRLRHSLCCSRHGACSTLHSAPSSATPHDPSMTRTKPGDMVAKIKQAWARGLPAAGLKMSDAAEYSTTPLSPCITRMRNVLQRALRAEGHIVHDCTHLFAIFAADLPLVPPGLGPLI